VYAEEPVEEEETFIEVTVEADADLEIEADADFDIEDVSEVAVDEPMQI